MNVALILAGGVGCRVGGEIPKQYIRIKDRMIITYCLQTLTAHEAIDAVQIVADQSWRNKLLEEMERMGIDRKKFRGFSDPGISRQLSVYQGLTDILKYSGYESAVLIHDSARPLVSSKQITECLTALQGHDGVLPVLPMKDTVYKSLDGNSVSGLLDRSCIFAGQAPEVFCLGKYYEANRKLLPDQILRINGSAEPAVLNGMDIRMIPGDEQNFKITTKHDLKKFQEISES